MSPLKLYNKFSALPCGKWLFSKAVCLKAPYFGTIRPQIQNLEPGYCSISIKNRRAIRNHLNSVHAIAMCNLAELTGGLAIDVSLDKSLRWIPKGMDVQYLKIAKTDLVSHCRVKSEDLKEGDNCVLVEVLDTTGQIVFTANINMYVSKKNKKAA